MRRHYVCSSFATGPRNGSGLEESSSRPSFIPALTPALTEQHGDKCLQQVNARASCPAYLPGTRARKQFAPLAKHARESRSRLSLAGGGASKPVGLEMATGP